MNAWELVQEYNKLGEQQLTTSSQIAKESNKEVKEGLFRQQDYILSKMTTIKHQLMKTRVF